MKTILFVHGGKVTDTSPSNRFAQRLDKAIDYYKKHQNDDIIFSYWVDGAGLKKAI